MDGLRKGLRRRLHDGLRLHEGLLVVLMLVLMLVVMLRLRLCVRLMQLRVSRENRLLGLGKGRKRYFMHRCRL